MGNRRLDRIWAAYTSIPIGSTFDIFIVTPATEMRRIKGVTTGFI